MGFDLPTPNSRLASAALSWLQNCDIDHTDFDPANEFILASWVHDTTPHSGSTSTFKLQWRRAGGSFADVTSTSEICWGTGTSLVDATTPVTSTGGCQTNVTSMENEGDNSCALPKVSSGDYGEIQWALGFGTGYADDQEYEFQVYDITNSNALGACAATLTTELVVPTAYKDIAIKTTFEAWQDAICFNDSRIGNASASWQEACWEDITDWDKADDFILATYAQGGIGNPQSFKLQWKEDGGSWADVGVDTEICYTADTVLVNGNTVANAAGCVSPIYDSEESEGDNIASITLEYNKAGEIQWALGFGSGAQDGVKYQFQLYCTENDNSMIVLSELTTASAVPTYKDITLKTSLESNFTYKDVTLKTTLESIPIYKDINLKTSLDSLDYKDVALKITLDALDYKDITLKTSLHSLDFKDIALQTSLESALTYKDITLKTTFESVPIFKDITLKTTLDSLDYKDITLKITLDSLDFKDVAIKTSLESDEITDYKDITLKTSLESVLTYKDISLKTTFDSLDFKDITLKITLDSLDYKDIAIKTSLETAGETTEYKDIALKISLDSLDHKDIALKASLHSLDYKDIALKTTFDSLDYKDIALKITLESIPIFKDVTLKTTLDSLEYKDITLKTSIESALTYKDITLKTTLESIPIFKDITLKSTLDSLDYKDITLKTSLESLNYKDIAIKISLDLYAVPTGYKDISIKVSLEAIPREIINFTSSINQTKNITSSINQTEDIISSITKTKNFISKLNS